MGIIIAAGIGMIGAALVRASGKDLAFRGEYVFGYVLALFRGLIRSSFSILLGFVKVEKEPMTIFTIIAAALSTILYCATMPHDLPSLRSLLSAVYLGCVPLGLLFSLE